MTKREIIFQEIISECNIDEKFLTDLIQHGFFDQSELERETGQTELRQEIRRIRRLNKDLEVNFPGIEVILHMRRKLEQMQEKVLKMEAAIEKMEQEHQQHLFNSLKQAGILQDIED